jgi:hypothetical protein
MEPVASDPKKSKARLRRYERALRKEFEEFGSYDDSDGKRYLLGPLYLRLGDLTGALQSFAWSEQAFPDDGGEPFHRLCWALALYRSGQLDTATQKLRETMLANLYLIPHLLGLKQARLDIWHGTNWAEPEYVQYASPEYRDCLRLWDPPALEWARETYHSPRFSQVRARYIEIFAQLKHEPPGHRRTELVREAFRLRAGDEDSQRLISAFQSDSVSLLTSTFAEIHLPEVCAKELVAHGWQAELGVAGDQLVSLKLTPEEVRKDRSLARQIAEQGGGGEAASHVGEHHVVPWPRLARGPSGADFEPAGTPPIPSERARTQGTAACLAQRRHAISQGRRLGRRPWLPTIRTRRMFPCRVVGALFRYRRPFGVRPQAGPAFTAPYTDRSMSCFDNRRYSYRQ